MDKKLEVMMEKTLKRETDVFLKEIDRLMENGVGEELSETHRKKGEKIPGRTQFKTLMDATGEAACVEELLLFISYQKSKKEGWEKMCKNNKEIAENVVESFMRVQDIIYAKIREETKDMEVEISDEEKRILKLKIAEKYMGYLYWKVSAVSRK